MSELQGKFAALQNLIKGLESALVAFSGGVDSTFLLRVCRDMLGERVVAVTAVSESYPAAELREAQALAQEMGARHLLIPTSELENPLYAQNPPDRCYHCKTELFAELIPLAQWEGLKWVLYGANADDALDFRPGMRAACERGARAPLLEVGLTKSEIRQLSQELGLATWDKPAFACLSSRVPYGQPITKEKLAQVEEAESYLRGLGFRQVRVRHHDDIARIELAPAEMGRLWADGLAGRVAAKLKEIGFLFVTLDLQGYRSGSMNEALPLYQEAPPLRPL